MGGAVTKRFPLLPSYRQMYCFGIINGKTSIIMYDARHRTFDMRVKVPWGMEFFDHVRACWVNESVIVVCGGINNKKKTVSNRAYLYIPITDEAIELQNMNIARYGHIITFIDGWLYVCGGKTIVDHKEVIVGECEKIFLGDVLKERSPDVEKIMRELRELEKESKKNKKNKNKVIPISKRVAEVKHEENAKWELFDNLKYPRSEGVIIIINKKAYCLGGQGPNGERVAQIETFIPKENEKWSVDETEFGLACDGVSYLKASENQILFFNGQDQFHLNNYWGIINTSKEFEKTTYAVEGSIEHRNYPKINPYSNQVHMIRFDHKENTNCVDVLDLTSKKNTTYPLKENIRTEWSAVGFSEHPIILTGDVKLKKPEKPIKWNDKNGVRMLHLFGTDNHPIYIQIDRATKNVVKLGLPLPIKEYSHMACTILNKTAYLFGGCSYNNDKTVKTYISDKIYTMDLVTGAGKRLELVLSRKLTNAAACTVEGEDKMVLCGGQTYREGETNPVPSEATYQFHWSTEGLVIVDNKPMAEPRYDHTTVYADKGVYAIGGIDKHGKPLDVIERLSISGGGWETCKFRLPSPLSKPGVFPIPKTNKILIIGGVLEDGKRCDEVSILDFKRNILKKKGKLIKAKEEIILWRDKKGAVVVYGDGKNVPTEKVMEIQENKVRGETKIRTTRERNKIDLPEIISEYFDNNPAELTLIT